MCGHNYVSCMRICHIIASEMQLVSCALADRCPVSGLQSFASYPIVPCPQPDEHSRTGAGTWHACRPDGKVPHVDLHVLVGAVALLIFYHTTNACKPFEIQLLRHQAQLMRLTWLPHAAAHTIRHL